MVLSIQELLVLAILAETERYGYEIFGIIRSRGIRDRYEFAISSVYSVLRRLENRGLVAARDYSQPPRPPRKIYSITETGRSSLMELLSSTNESAERTSAIFDI